VAAAPAAATVVDATVIEEVAVAIEAAATVPRVGTAAATAARAVNVLPVKRTFR
jgi:hypothetical protein